jgi:hypothetical protein
MAVNPAMTRPRSDNLHLFAGVCRNVTGSIGCKITAMRAMLDCPRFLLGFFLIAMLLAPLGCRQDPQVSLDQQTANLTNQWQSWQKRFDTAKEKQGPVTWEAALKAMRQNNQPLQKSRAEVKKTAKLKQQAWKSAIPLLHLSLGVTERLDQLDELSADNLRVDVFLSELLSNLLSLPGALYAAELQSLSAKLAHRMAVRHEVATLYLHFVRAQSLRKQKALLANLRQAATAAPDGLSDGQQRLKQRAQQLAEQRRRFQRDFALLTGRICDPAQLKADTLPALDQAREHIDQQTLKPGSIWLKLKGLDILRQQAQMHGIRMRYWPDFSLYISGNSLVERRDGRTFFLDDQTSFLDANVRVRIDTRGTIAEQLRQEKIDLAVLKKSIRRDLGRAMFTVQNAQARLKTLHQKVSKLDNQQKLLKDLLQRGRPNALDNVLRKAIEIWRERQAVERQRVRAVLSLVWVDAIWSRVFADDVDALPAELR